MKTRYTDEEKLIRDFNKGHARALAEVYDMHFYPLYYFAYRFTRNKAEAEDITIVTLGIVMSKYQDFESLGKLKSYLYVTVRNKCLKYIAQQEKERGLRQELAESQSEALDEHILAEIVRTEYLKEIFNRVENLSPQKRMVFKLFYEDGLSNSEIAEKLHISSEAVRTNKSKALEQLRIVLFNRKPKMQATTAIGIFSLIKYIMH